ncbi:MAG TPA: hypothetical protein VFQ90_16745 [Stellaceae bacterium]|jgi:hypothetical protein|nr:hypothetical protein [Stellaceae bacterium]
MFKPISPESVADIEFIPQAIVSQPPSYFSRRLNVKFAHDHDDFDDYEVAVFEFSGYGDRFPFTLMRYAGYPDDTTTIYLPMAIKELPRITKTIQVIAKDLDIPAGWIVWQRADNPEL